MKKISFAILVCLAACQSITDKNIEISAIKPPLPHLNLLVTEYQINPNRDTILRYKTGSKIYVPKNAFVQQNGDIVNTSVKLQYREFHSSVDIFLSGIPMQYDSAGTQYHFESAGMCELYGFEGNNPLQIAKEKACKIEMASQKASTKFNLYQLDTSSGVWTNLGKDIVKNIVTEKQVPKNSQKESKKITKDFAKIAKPIKPTEANPDRPWLQIDVEESQFPELSAYKNVVFVVLETTPYNTENQKIIWDKISLKKGNKQGTYKILFEKEERKGEYDVQPALQGEDYQTALKDYEKKFANYEATKKQIGTAKETLQKESQAREKQAQDEMTQAIAAEKLRQENDVKFLQEQERQQSIIDEKERKEQVVAFEKEQREDQEKQTILNEKQRKEQEQQNIEFEKQRKEQEKQFIAAENLRLKKATKLENNQIIVYRTINANSFGVYNCDAPQNLPKEKRIVANFISIENQIIATSVMILGEKNPNITYNYYSNYRGKFQFNPKKENFIFCITNEGYLAYFTSADFEKMPKDIEEYNFKMKIHKEKLQSQEELEKLLGI